MRLRWTELMAFVLPVVTGILLMALQWKPWGWLILAAGLVSLLSCRPEIRRYFFLVYIAVGILSLTPISTDTSVAHITLMGVGVIAAVVVPHLIERYGYRGNVLGFNWRLPHWTARHTLYLALTVALSYLILPWYFRSTHAHLNWMVGLDAGSLIRLAIGTNGLGLWDELFFINTIFPVFRRFLPFWPANILQTGVFAAFLYELGFTGWGWALIGVFALAQGYVYDKTRSLRYVVILHLAMDAVLYLALVEAHFPGTIPIW